MIKKKRNLNIFCLWNVSNRPNWKMFTNLKKTKNAPHTKIPLPYKSKIYFHNLLSVLGTSQTQFYHLSIFIPSLITQTNLFSSLCPLAFLSAPGEAGLWIQQFLYFLLNVFVFTLFWFWGCETINYLCFLQLTYIVER